MFKDVFKIVRKYSKTKEPLWIQCWLNYHSDKQVLDWHDHKWLFHGYISIDPKDTKTIFENGSINTIFRRLLGRIVFEVRLRICK